MIELIEPVPVDDDLCTGLALVEDLGFGARFVLYAEQRCYESGNTAHVIKRKIVLPMEAIRPGIEMTLTFLAKRAMRCTRKGLLRLVR